MTTYAGLTFEVATGQLTLDPSDEPPVRVEHITSADPSSNRAPARSGTSSRSDWSSSRHAQNVSSAPRDPRRQAAPIDGSRAPLPDDCST